MQNSIEKFIEIRAPIARVWRALTDHEEFGEWFQVNLQAPFRIGEMTYGQNTYPGYEHLKFHATVTAMELERLFAFRWCPYAYDPDIDYSNEPTTLVEFKLEPTDDGTRLLVTESGFNALPEEWREKTWRSNTRGWNEQVKNIAAHVES